MGKLAHKLFRYGLTAGVAALVDWGGFLMLLRAGTPLTTAAISSFIAAAATNYSLTSRYVFRARRSVAGFAGFFAVALAGLAINLAVTLTAVRVIGLSPALAKALGIGLAFFVNFALNLLVVFRSTGAEPPQFKQR